MSEPNRRDEEVLTKMTRDAMMRVGCKLHTLAAYRDECVKEQQNRAEAAEARAEALLVLKEQAEADRAKLRKRIDELVKDWRSSLVLGVDCDVVGTAYAGAVIACANQLEAVLKRLKDE